MWKFSNFAATQILIFIREIFKISLNSHFKTSRIGQKWYFVLFSHFPQCEMQLLDMIDKKNLVCIAIFCVKIQEKVSFLQSYKIHTHYTVDNQLQKWIRISHLGKSITVFHVNEIIVNFHTILWRYIGRHHSWYGTCWGCSAIQS